jgi:hypothetical protein
MLELTEISLHLPQLPDYLRGLRILQVGDLHIRGYGQKERHLRRIISQGCDLLIFTGDFCHQLRFSNPFATQTYEPLRIGLSRQGLIFAAHTDLALEVCEKLLEECSPTLGAFAVQGNHDPNEFMQHLPRLGVTTLTNETQQVHVSNGSYFNLCGLRGYGRSTIDIAQTMLTTEPALFTIAVCHYPEIGMSLAGAGADLILSGHTHGGQICLPSGRPLVTHSFSGHQYATGLERIGSSFIYTTRGLGCSVIPIRLFCPPEITRITLQHGDHGETTIEATRL